MNNLPLLTQFFTFLIQSMHNSRQDAAKLILRIPGSRILHFAHSYIKPSPVSDEGQKVLLETFVSTLCKLLQHLLELHPSCYDQLSSIGIFDRLEMYGQKTSVSVYLSFSLEIQSAFIFRMMRFS